MLRSDGLPLRALTLISLLTALLPMAAAQRDSAAPRNATPRSIAPVAVAQLTIAQFRQILAAPPEIPLSQLPGQQPSRDSVPVAMLEDATQATQIDRISLSERLTAATLKEILSQHAFGQQTQHALELLADRSALLDPPADELPSPPAPSLDQQKQMMDATSAFVFQALTHLPNFFATRTSAQFYGIPPELNQTGMPAAAGMHPRGSASHEITYREGKEVIDPMKSPRPSPTLPLAGLETYGEFGPEPAVVLTDSAFGKVAFHHWENLPTGLAAVFRYSVPESESHYAVNYACNGSNAFHVQPAYHGTLAIDPATGAILRLTIQADSKPGDPISHVASVIEYGPVVIGEKTYICPLRSLAFSVEERNECTMVALNRGVVRHMRLNRITFSNYHRLGSTSRIILDSSKPEPPKAEQAPQP